MKMDFLKEIENEYRNARIKYKSFNSTHEGIAVIQEEVDELWDLVKKNKGYKIDNPQMIRECIQIAAMAYAFAKDLSE